MEDENAKQDSHMIVPGTEQWSEEDIDNFIVYLKQQRATSLDHEQRKEAAALRMNEGLYIAALFSRQMVEDIITFYRMRIAEALFENIKRDWRLKFMRERRPHIIRDFVIYYLSPVNLTVSDYDSAAAAINQGENGTAGGNKWKTLRKDMLDQIQVGVVAFSVSTVEVAFVNIIDPVETTRRTTFQLDFKQDPEDQECEKVANAIVQFAHKMLVFQERDRLARYR
jgi:hypothetical protein